jgi:hypothetical protein
MNTYVTDDYELIVESKEEENGTVQVYRVMHKTFDVVEYEDYLLPRTIDTMLEMQERLNAVKTKYNEYGTPPIQLKLVEGDTDGEGIIH